MHARARTHALMHSRMHARVCMQSMHACMHARMAGRTPRPGPICVNYDGPPEEVLWIRCTHAWTHARMEARARARTSTHRHVGYPANFSFEGKTYVKRAHELNRTISVFQDAFRDFTLANRYNQTYFQTYGAPIKLPSIKIFGEKQLYGTKCWHGVSHR